MRHYDYESPVSQCVADYLKAAADPAIVKACPPVTFFDPMNIDDPQRLVVMVPNGATDAASPGNFDCQVEVGIKSQWAQPSIAEDFAAHMARVAEYRDKLMSPSLADDLSALGDGIRLDFVQPVRQFSMRITTDGWVYSETRFTLSGHWEAPSEDTTQDV